MKSGRKPPIVRSQGAIFDWKAGVTKVFHPYAEGLQLHAMANVQRNFHAKLATMSRSDRYEDRVESLFLASTGNETDLHFYVLKGTGDVLRMQAVLAQLSELCEQIGAMDHIALFLGSSMNKNKTAYLVLVTKFGVKDPFALQAGELLGAALVYQYEFLDRSTGIYVTDDGSGSRTVIAPPASRSFVTIKVCEHLMARGAQAALLSYKEEVAPQPQDAQIARTAARIGLVWGSQVRDMSTYFTLQSTFDGTLGRLGKHTRRNLRYYRRRAELELGCGFVPDVASVISKDEFLGLNGSSTHPIDKREVLRRYNDLSKIRDTFCVGMRAADGRWLSLMGGRRHHGWTEVDWQMNRAGLERLSLGTAMRSYFLENEVALGMSRLYFEGGTPHTMRHSLMTEKAVDIIALRPSWRVSLLRRFARSRFGKKNFLLQTLANPEIRWQKL